MSNSYAGDLSAREAWELLSREPEAALVDCRTDAEWAFVGLPDLGALGKETIRVAWQLYPDMRQNPNFARELQARGIGPATPVVFICRSGARSRAAAEAMTAAGSARCFNLAGGFEGPVDDEGHRGGTDGWKAAGLPWVQQ